MKISVALCTYNGEKYINEQIDSILNQTTKVDEIIVCDDQSTDATITILEKYNAANNYIFKIIKNETNLRSVKNFEKAISLCTGDIIFLSDQDDIWLPNKVEKYIDYFKNNSEIEVIASNGFCINENSEVLDRITIWDVPQFLRNKNIAFNYYSLITQVGNFATGASMAFKKQLLSDILPFPIVKNFHHDEWIAMIAAKKQVFALLNEKYFQYRVHAAQQVGGVCYKVSKKKKKALIENYSIVQITSFVGFKRRLKKLHYNLIKNIELAEKSDSHKFVFKDNCIEIETKFKETKALFLKQFPIRARLLSISDFILKKRNR